MDSREAKSAWFEKGATLSDKSARKEFGLTQEEITVATTVRKKNQERVGTGQQRIEDVESSSGLSRTKKS